MGDTLVAEYATHAGHHRLIKRTTTTGVLLLDYNGRPSPSLVGRFRPRERGITELAADYLRAEDKTCRDYDPQVDSLPEPEPIEGPVHLTYEQTGDSAYLGVVDGHATWVLATSTTGPAVITLRDVCGHFETYVPFVNASRWAIRAFRGTGVALRLKRELQGVEGSPIVLNRLLREAIQARCSHKGDVGRLAAKCGRVNKDGYGESSWLLRRAGAIMEPGQKARKHWIHTTVLVEIAEGMGVAPGELELPFD